MMIVTDGGVCDDDSSTKVGQDIVFTISLSRFLVLCSASVINRCSRFNNRFQPG